MRSHPVFVGLIISFTLLFASCSSTPSSTSEAQADTTTTVVTTTTVAAKGVATGRSAGTIQSAGLERSYSLNIPSSYDGSSPMPLMVVFHGMTMTARDQESESALPAFGEEHGFISVFPEGQGDPQRWLFDLESDQIDITMNNPDMRFFEDLLDKLIAELNIDTDRIYVVGFSNGGWVASAVACTLPDRIAAAAPVAGITDFGEDCARSVPVPVITFHGTSDTYEPFGGGIDNAPGRDSLPVEISGGTFGELPVATNPVLEPSVPDRVQAWAALNGCAGEIESTDHDSTALRWQYMCPDGAAVEFYEIPNGTHWWDIIQGFETNPLLWDFLSTGVP
ncbi:MAG: alpha/beta hydrolase family esterase [Acidimicrobiia bacterium]